MMLLMGMMTTCESSSSPTFPCPSPSRYWLLIDLKSNNDHWRWCRWTRPSRGSMIMILMTMIVMIMMMLMQVDLYTTEQRVSSAPVTINAHKNELVCLAVSQQGGMVRIFVSTRGHGTFLSQQGGMMSVFVRDQLVLGGDCKHKGNLDKDLGHSKKVNFAFLNLCTIDWHLITLQRLTSKLGVPPKHL